MKKDTSTKVVDALTEAQTLLNKIKREFDKGCDPEEQFADLRRAISRLEQIAFDKHGVARRQPATQQ